MPRNSSKAKRTAVAGIGRTTRDRTHNDIVLVKLGGSLLTDKPKVDAFRATATTRLLRELSGVPNLVLVHGAGSFGHPHVKAAGIGEGPLDAKRKAGVKRTMRALQELATCVAASAPPAMPLAYIPLDAVRRSGSRIVGFPMKHVRAALKAGEIPVLHGTLIGDDAVGASVFGGDDIMLLVARAVRPTRVVFATDVDGVYDRDPAERGAKLLASIGASGKPGPATARGRGRDVTGRMEGKLRQARSIARMAPTVIVNGRVAGRVARAARGRRVKGTRVLS